MMPPRDFLHLPKARANLHGDFEVTQASGSQPLNWLHGLYNFLWRAPRQRVLYQFM